MKINNKYLGIIFNKFDVPIRFLYSKLGLNRLFFWKFYSSDFKKLDNQFEEIKKLLIKNKFNFKDKICLELGPGNSYINGYNFFMVYKV
jgi:hypothetical protein